PTCRPPVSPLFPYTTLFRSLLALLVGAPGVADRHLEDAPRRPALALAGDLRGHLRLEPEPVAPQLHPLDHLALEHLVAGLHVREDRKSTRLNSSHVSISYAV